MFKYVFGTVSMFDVRKNLMHFVAKVLGLVQRKAMHSLLLGINFVLK